MSLLPVIEQQLMFARGLVGAPAERNGVAAPTRQWFGGENGRKKFQKVPASEWRRLLSEALPRVGLMLRATHGAVVDGSLMSTFRLTYVGAGLGFGAVDEWTVATPMGPAPSRDLAAQWARTKAVSGVARDLLWQWDESDEAQEEPDEQPKRSAPAHKNGNGHERVDPRSRPPVGINRTETIPAPIGGPTVILDKKDGGDWIVTGESPGRFGPVKGKPHTVPPGASMAEHLGLAPGDGLPASSVPGSPNFTPAALTELAARGFERINQPAKPAPSQAGEAGTAEPARSAVNPSTDAGATALRSEQADGTAPASGPNTDGGAPPSPLASSSTPLTSEASDPSEVGGGSAVRTEVVVLVTGTPAEHAKANEKARASRAFARVSSWPDDQREKWLEDSKSADDAAYRKRLVMLARGQTPGECVDIACGEHPTGEEHNAALQALIDEDDAEPLAEPSPEQVSLVGAVARRVDDEATAAAKANTRAFAASLLDTRGQRRAERLRSMGERPVLREIVGRKGGKCPACGVEFKKGDEVEVRGGKRRCVVCPGKAVTA